MNEDAESMPREVAVSPRGSRMFVLKRIGVREAVDVRKIEVRIRWITEHPTALTHVDVPALAASVAEKLCDGIRTCDIDTYASDLAHSMRLRHSEYDILAGRIAINNHHKKTLHSFRDKMEKLYLRKDEQGSVHPLLTPEFHKFVQRHATAIDRAIDYDRDYWISYFGFRTMERGYLMRLENDIIERPQDLFMREAIMLHLPKKRDASILTRIFATYDNLSRLLYTHATPTMFNAGTPNGNYSSCFLLGSADSLEGILKTQRDCAMISKYAGGVGFHNHWRAQDSLIRGTNGVSSGIVPFLRLFNDTARAFNQGGKRPGSFAAYLEPHHPDIMSFLQLRRNSGDENLRCRDLFLALWVSDLFMERVKTDASWSTFCPDQCPGLNDCYGDAYRELYMQYEQQGKAKHVYRAQEIWRAIFESQKESGMPYMLYKDTVNRCNMQSNIGVIRSSNLCAEITLYSDTQQTAVCNLASICLPQFVKDSYAPEELARPEEERRVLNHKFPKRPYFDYTHLLQIVGEMVYNLNQVIDRTWNPVVEAARSNFRNRPIGIGVQGLADVFFKFRLPFESEGARDLNRRIFESIYYAALSQSSKLARTIYKQAVASIHDNSKGMYAPKIYPDKVRAQYPELRKEEMGEVFESVPDLPTQIGAYPSYMSNGGSPLSHGKFHWELWGLHSDQLSGMYDWESLRAHIAKFGIRNSTLIALMPTASTSQIMGCSSCFEPYVSNLYMRKTQAGDFIITNDYLIHDLVEAGLWNDSLRQELLAHNGSIQHIDGIPDEFRALYKTVWELKQRVIMDMARDRQPFVDQSQSMNLYAVDFTLQKFSSMQMHAWESGLKTGCYYLRSRAALSAQKFTIDPALQERARRIAAEWMEEARAMVDVVPEETCLACSS